MKNQFPGFVVVALALLSTLNPQLSTTFAQGSLTPPGAPAATMKTLQQVEPRAPISSLPYTISNAGSYYLTTNLTGVSGFDGIIITADDVAIDLKGFSVIGVSGAGSGVFAGIRTNLAVHNGTLRGWGSSAISASSASYCQYRELRVLNNAGRGIYAGDNCVIQDCVVVSNTLSGIDTLAHCRIQDCTATGNARSGFFPSSECLLVGCNASANGSNGFQCARGCVLKNCSAAGNTLAGIEFPSGKASALDCVAHANGQHGIHGGDSMTLTHCSATENGEEGISAGQGAVILGCTAGSNTFAGISGEAGCVVKDSTATGNGFVGIGVSNGSNVKDCAASDNGFGGIDAPFQCGVESCRVWGNSGDGISIYSSSVTHCTSTANSGHGIHARGHCRIVGNLCHHNSTSNQNGSIAGIYAENDGNHLESNAVNDNNIGIRVAAAGNLVIKNSAHANTGGNYVIDPGNSDAQVLSPGSGFISTDPSANFSY